MVNNKERERSCQGMAYNDTEKAGMVQKEYCSSMIFEKKSDGLGAYCTYIAEKKYKIFKNDQINKVSVTQNFNERSNLGNSWDPTKPSVHG